MKKSIKKYQEEINWFHSALLGFSFIGKVANGKKFEYKVFDVRYCSPSERMLASVVGDEETVKLYEDVLKIMNASYNKVSNNRIEFFDPECVEYEDAELPVYRKNKDGSYSYTHTTTIIKNVPTLKMVDASLKYREEIEKSMARTELNAEVNINSELGRDGVSTIVETPYEITSEYLDPEEYYTVVIKRPYKQVQKKYMTLVIKKDLIPDRANNGVLPIALPKDVAGIVIGKGGSGTKKIASDLGLKYIDVKAY